jgi:hypothetical protein
MAVGARSGFFANHAGLAPYQKKMKACDDELLA